MGLRGALKASPQNAAYPYLLPMWAFSFFLDQFASQTFLEPWSTFSVCICLVQLVPKQSVRRLRHTPSEALNVQEMRVPFAARR
jgi:hypothetical protein